MRVKVSYYVAKVGGKSVYETSHLIHDDEAWLCWLHDPLGFLITQYVNPIGQYGDVPEKHSVWTFPAKRFMTETRKECVRASYSGGVQEE